MRNDFKACDGPITTKAAAEVGRARRRRTMRRGLLALPLALVLMVGGAGTALAAEPTSGYSQTSPAPKTTPTPKGEAAPTNTSSTPSKETKAETPSSGVEPTATSTTKASTLPFTGLDLRWVILAGVLLVGMGASIVLVGRGRGSARR